MNEEEFEYLFISVKFMSTMSGTFNITLLSCIVCLVGSCQFLELILLLLGENKVLEVHLAITINFRNIHRLSMAFPCSTLCVSYSQTEMKTSPPYYHLHPVLDLPSGSMSVALWEQATGG